MDWATGKHQESFKSLSLTKLPFIHVPCVSMLFWDRCLVLQVCLGHVGSMAFPNHQPSNSLIQRIPSSNSMSMYFQFPFSSHFGWFHHHLIRHDSSLCPLLNIQTNQLAENCHSGLLIKMAGDAAIKRGWVYFAEANDCLGGMLSSQGGLL